MLFPHSESALFKFKKNKTTSKNNYQIPTIVKNRKKIIVSFFWYDDNLCTYYTKSCLFITIHFLVYYCSILSRFFLLKYETTHNKKQKLQKMPCIIASNLFYFISFAKDLLLSSTNLNHKVEIRYQQWTSNQLPNLASHFWYSEFDFIALSRFFPLHARVLFQYQSSKFWIFSFTQNAKLLTFHRILPKTQIKCSIWHFFS